MASNPDKAPVASLAALVLEMDGILRNGIHGPQDRSRAARVMAEALDYLARQRTESNEKSAGGEKSDARANPVFF